MISVQDLSVTLDGARLLRGVDLDVAAGEWVCVLGPNGAGKSTLVRSIAGVCPSEGTITLEGRDADALRTRERARLLALVAQSPIVPEGMAVEDYLLLGRTPHLRRFGVEQRRDLVAVAEVVARLGLGAFIRRPLDSLSGGERQRVVLGRALVQEAPVLVLDEPTSALDIGHQQEVLDLVDELRSERGLTVLSTMHDLTLAGQYADRLVLLAGGRVVAEGSADAVLEPNLLKTHFDVNVRVLQDEDGLLVLPVRGARARRGADTGRAG